jgi:nitroreductase
MTAPRLVPLSGYRDVPQTEMLARARAFAEEAARRRSVRDFSPRPVPREVLEACLRAAGSAPSGANQQPWRFVVVGDAAVKHRIREAAEAEERAFYRDRAPEDWLAALAPLGTDEHKPFLDIAPWLVVVFAEQYGLGPDGTHRKHYYVQESVGIATGILVAALHHAGLACLTHTPSPMGFLAEILGRPKNERAFLLLVVGYPADGAMVPDITRKTLGEICEFV